VEVKLPRARAYVLTVLLLGLLILSSPGLGLSHRDQDLWRSIDRAISRIEDALDAVEEIQTAEDLEEAQDLADDAEGDLRDAISILEDVEIPNWLYLPEQGALYWHGPILDKNTEQPVEAKVLVNGRLVADQATEVQFLMWATEEEPVWVRIVAKGYNPWELRFKFHLEGLKTLEGPVWLQPQEQE